MLRSLRKLPMSYDPAAIPRPFLFLASAACVVVVVAGLKDAGDIALPVLFSLFIAILVWPLVSWLNRVGCPRGISILFAMLLVAATMVASTAVVTDSVANFTASMPKYQEPLDAEISAVHEWLSGRGLGRMAELESLLDPASIIQAVRTTAGAILGLLSNVIIIVVTTAIVLLEATELGRKIEVAFGREGGWVNAVGERVQRYLAIKTVMSMLMGVLLGAWTAGFGLEFAVLWGLIAFVFNFIPAFGAFIAAVPPVALALVELGPGTAAVIALGYVVVHVAIGSLLEPRIMGRRLGLSPFVVVVSLFFWGYVWGPGGMLIAVPLTVIGKLVLES
ncbi:MAG: AI-2E family transporter, partial [Oligoflexia bacterium]|nr:AI-2E family transporter [Oligoflexia bacterium]